MLYNTQNYWVFGLCLSSRYYKYYRAQRFGNWICFHPQVRGETHTLLSSFRRKQIQFLKRCVL
jgi:hypothetical protein